MRKIFEELAQEAGVHHINYDEEYSVEFEKFAELIVLECADWLSHREFASPEALKHHFGVK